MMNTETTQGATLIPENQSTAPDNARAGVPAGAEPDPEAPDDGADALAKVRELLFGEQARDADKRLRELERHFSEALARISREVSERIENLSRDLHAQLDEQANQAVRLEATFKEQHEKNAQRIAAARDELTDRMNQDTNAMYERITADHAKAIAYVDRAAGTLDESKMDREALAALFSEMASRVDRR